MRLHATVILFSRLIPSTLVLAVVALCPASAHSSEPVLAVRVGGGSGVGLGVGASPFDGRLRLDASAFRTLDGFTDYAGDVAATVRLVGTSAMSLGLRAGYMLAAGDDIQNQLDLSHSADAGLAFRKAWDAGHWISVEGGVEAVFRGEERRVYDSGVLRTSSLGARFAVNGLYAFSQHIGAFARAEIRTGDHETEIPLMPIAMAGISLGM